MNARRRFEKVLSCVAVAGLFTVAASPAGAEILKCKTGLCSVSCLVPGTDAKKIVSPTLVGTPDDAVAWRVGFENVSEVDLVGTRLTLRGGGDINTLLLPANAICRFKNIGP